MGASLERIRIDLINGNLERLAPFSLNGIWNSCGWYARQEGIQPLSKGAALGVDYGGIHTSKSFIPAGDAG
jgi:hypothetical protein